MTALFAGLIAWVSGVGSAAERTVVDVAPDATWRYWDRTTSVAAGWKQGSFDDRAWGSGRAQLGFGDGGEATILTGRPLTTYFRTTFQASGTATSATLWLVVDDGAVVYLNGVEVIRDNIGTGTDNAALRASSGRSGSAENAVRSFTLPTNLVNLGANTLAVSVHQDTPSSSDLSFSAAIRSTAAG